MERQRHHYALGRPVLLGLALGFAQFGLMWLIYVAGCTADGQAVTPAFSSGHGLPTGTSEIAGLTDSCTALAGDWTYTSVTYLSETHEVSVYLPVDYPTDAPYPVVYLLHGHGMILGMWERSDVKDQADQNGLVLVAVEGDDADIIASWYSRQAELPWPSGPDWKVSFYDWFFQGVLPWVESTYDVRADPGGRAIVGFSMGGKGALSLACHRPDLFSAAAGIAGVMDLRDYSTVFEIPDVYGPLVGNEMVYAADSPFDLAPNLKGVSLTLLHGAEDRLVDREQSRKMSQALDDLGYPHLWEELPGQDHEPVSTYEITRTLEQVSAALNTPYSPPAAWRYRFADDTIRQVYDTTLTKTDPLTWTEVMSMTTTGFEVVSGDAFSLTTAPQYTPLTGYVVTATDLSEGGSMIKQVIADEDGRLSLSLPAGRHRIAISAANLLERIFLPVIFKAAPESGSLAGLCDLPDCCCQARFLLCLPLW